MTTLQQGIDALRGGQRDEARKFLVAAIKENPNDERAWQWMCNAAKDDSERIYCLKRILQINPKNEKAGQFLNQLTNSMPILSEKSSSVPSHQKFNPQQKILIGIGSLLFISCLCIGLSLAIVSLTNGDKKVSSTPIPTISVQISLPTQSILPTQPISNNCNPAYPGVCTTHDQSCKELKAQGISNFSVVPPDPFGFDRDKDGIGCEN